MQDIKVNSFRAWMLAIRPKTLSGALLPVALACALAFNQGCFRWLPSLICILFAMLMQVIANFVNDLVDFQKGSDREDRLGPKRACAQGWITAKMMKRGILILLVITCLIGSILLFFRGLELLLIGLFSVVFAFLYSTGPYPLSYKGFGDLLVLIFFGFVPVCTTYYILSGMVSFSSLIVALESGLIIDTLLVLNNYRDRDQDKISGKRTVVVRFGEQFGSIFYLSLGVIACVLNAIWFYVKLGNVWVAFLPMFYLPLHIQTWREMVKINSGKELNSILGKTSRNMLFFGILLTIALIIS